VLNVSNEAVTAAIKNNESKSPHLNFLYKILVLNNFLIHRARRRGNVSLYHYAILLLYLILTKQILKGL